MRDSRTVERVLLAASQVECDNDREAAILGGIVGSLLNTGHLNGNYVAHHTQAALQWAEPIARQIWRAIADHDTPPFWYPPALKPTGEEQRIMAARFIAKYDPREPEAVS